MSEADEARWWAAHTQATKAFADVPGVVGVGLGIKEVARQLTEEVAVIVYVDVKKPKDQLDAAALIPDQIAGVSTDVQTQPQVAPFGGTTLDGGAQIRRAPDAQDRPKPGTLGYIATKTDGNVNVMLSCDHVMLSRRQDDRRIFHPDVSRCCGKLKNAVGVVTEGFMGHAEHTNSVGTERYFVDAAIATIDAGINARKFIPGVGAIHGSGDITAAPTGSGSPTITVRKRGAATGVTEGTVADVVFSIGPALRVFRIRPNTGHTFPFSITWTVPPEDVADHLTDFPAQTGGTVSVVGTDTLKFEVPVFATPGDSGAVVIDTSSGNLIGMVFTGDVYPLRAFKDGRLGTGIVPTGAGIACHLQPVLSQLGLRIDPSTTPSGGRDVLMPGHEVSTDAPERLQEINQRVAALENELEASPAGRRLKTLVREHADELMDLVHHRRRVFVQWHRNHGPAFSARLIESMLDDERALPTVVGGVERHQLLQRMRGVLTDEGSPALRRALADNSEFLHGVLDHSRSTRDLIANLSCSR